MNKNNKKNSKQYRNTETAIKQSSTPSETPKNPDLTVGQLALTLAQKNEKEVEQLKENINSPEWTKEIIKSQLFISNFIKWILIIFLIISSLLTISFFGFIAFKIISLSYIFEDIRNSKVLEINDSLLKNFNTLFYETRLTINLISQILGVGIVISFVGHVLTKSVEKFIENLKINKIK